jgi:hypothetical protein
MDVDHPGSCHQEQSPQVPTGVLVVRHVDVIGISAWGDIEWHIIVKVGKFRVSLIHEHRTPALGTTLNPNERGDRQPPGKLHVRWREYNER